VAGAGGWGLEGELRREMWYGTEYRIGEVWTRSRNEWESVATEFVACGASHSWRALIYVAR
jgi:hypothetical protein